MLAGLHPHSLPLDSLRSLAAAAGATYPTYLTYLTSLTYQVSFAAPI